MNSHTNEKMVKALGWTVTKVAINKENHNQYITPANPRYKECLEKYGFKFGVNKPSDYETFSTRKLYSGYNDDWFDSEEEAWEWLSEKVYFDSDLNEAMSLFDGTGISVTLSQPAANLNHYSASISNHPASFSTNLYTVSSQSWAEAVCLCWLTYKSGLTSAEVDNPIPVSLTSYPYHTKGRRVGNLVDENDNGSDTENIFLNHAVFIQEQVNGHPIIINELICPCSSFEKALVQLSRLDPNDRWTTPEFSGMRFACYMITEEIVDNIDGPHNEIYYFNENVERVMNISDPRPYRAKGYRD